MVTCDELRKMGDVNGDGRINQTDVEICSAAFGTVRGQAGYIEACDLDNSGNIDIMDITAISRNVGMDCVSVWFPRLAIPAVTIMAGRLLDVWLMNINLRIPPSNFTLWNEIELVPAFKLFEWGGIIGIFQNLTQGIPNAIVKLFTGWLEAEFEKDKREHPERYQT